MKTPPPHTTPVGTFLVHDHCIDCGQCPSDVPEVFRTDETTALAFVWRQPETLELIDEARRAIERCPVEAIEEAFNAGPGPVAAGPH